MASFIEFYFHFSNKFSDLNTSPRMFSIFIYIMSRVTHSEPGLPMFQSLTQQATKFTIFTGHLND